MSEAILPTMQHYEAPRSLEEAADLLRLGNVTILAGGTDLMPQSKTGKIKIKPVLMNICRVEGLRGLTEVGSVLHIGATTTITDLYDSSLVKSRLSALWQACDHFASDQIRNAGTIGGNICNASPAGDTLVPLLVLNARVVLVAKSNGALTQRIVPLGEFFAGPGKVRREPSELLTAVEIDMPPPGFISIFFKFGIRPALDISTISIGLGAICEKERLRDVRVALGAVAPIPIRAPHIETALEGKAIDDATIAAACAAASEDGSPISDVRASNWYRREMVSNMLERMLNNVRNG